MAHDASDTTSADGRRLRVARAVLRIVARALGPEADVELALASDAAAPRTRAARIVVASPDAVGRLLWPPTADAFGEAYLRGDLEIEGDVVAAIDAGRGLDLRALGADLRRLLRWGLELRRGAASAPRLERVARLGGLRHSRARDLAAVRFHYDVGNEFYALWLDRRLTYSCAYFDTPASSIDEAQEAKLELVCRKLGLSPGMRFLDIGCGWGSLVLFAAERHGVQAVGVTLSEAQARLARQEIERRGMADRVRVEIRDYRDLAALGTFDAVASIGMFEHVGHDRLPEYFGAVLGALRPDGLFLNHGIATTASARTRLPVRLRHDDGGFIARYVFPDGELVTVEEAIRAARRSGFELIDAQSLRPHYALTLRAWVERLEASADDARLLAGEEVYRTWRLYMAAARTGFEDGSLDVVQLLLARPGPCGPAERPLRPWWREPHDADVAQVPSRAAKPAS